MSLKTAAGQASMRMTKRIISVYLMMVRPGALRQKLIIPEKINTLSLSLMDWKSKRFSVSGESLFEKSMVQYSRL